MLLPGKAWADIQHTGQLVALLSAFLIYVTLCFTKLSEKYK